MKINWFSWINSTLLILMSLLFIIPFIFLINQSFMSNEAILKYGYTLIPRDIALYSYKYLLVDNIFIYKGLAVSMLITTTGTFFCLVFTCAMAYGLSKKYLPYRNFLTLVVLVTMFFSGGLIPSYLLVTNLGLRDSYWALILPALISPWYMLLMRNFFMEIPQEVEESAQIDGANEVGVLMRIIIPMSLPTMATIGLFYAVGHWNNWFSAAIFISSQDKWPLQLILRGMLANLDLAALGKNPALTSEWMKNMPKEGVKAAATLLTTLPIICVYPFIQKYFVKGMMVGSIKG